MLTHRGVDILETITGKIHDIKIVSSHSPDANQLVIRLQRYAPIKIIGIKIIVPIKSEKSLRLMVHISKTLTKSLR